MTTTTLTTRDGCVSLAVPSSWDVHRDISGVPLVVLEDAAPFRTNAVLTYSALPAGTGLEEWQAGTEGLLPESLADYLPLDREEVDVAGRPGVRRLAHHTNADEVALTMAQWCTVVGATGVTLTLTCDTMRYPELRDALQRIAGSIAVHDEPDDPAPGAGGGGA